MLGRGNSSAFTPASLPNLAVWFDPSYGVYSDAGVTPAVHDDPVYRWVARYPLDGSIYADQSTLGARPLYKIGANGKAYISFPDSTDALVSNYTEALGDFMAGVAFKMGSALTAYERLIDKVFNAGFFIGRDDTNANSIRSGIVDGSVPLGIAIALTDGVWNNAFTRRSGTDQTLTNGDGVSNSGTCVSTAMSSDALWIGSSALGGGVTADIGNIIIANAATSDADIAALASYFSAQEPT